MKKLITRLFIMFFWVFAIFIALYFPRWKVFPYEEKSINVFAWGETLDPGIFAQFEKETGIKIHLSFYASNEELLVKMKATEGEGYDLIMPSDYTVAQLIKEDLLQPLDHSKLTFYKDLNKALLNHFYDPENRYSVPFEWEIFGLGVDRKYFKDKPFTPSWKAVFDSEVVNYKIATKNDPVEAVLFASLYLYGKTDSISEEEFQEIRKLLLEQRKWVEAYTDFRSDYFIATGNCPVAVSLSQVIKQIRPQFPHIDFVLPKEGSFISIENFCIPKASTKQKYTYLLLNRLYEEESLILHYDHFGFFPATANAIDILDLEPYEKELLQMTREDFNKIHFIRDIFPQKKVRDLWVEVKSF